MNNNDSKFSSGFILGLIIGGGLVFLLGTKTGKNLLKIVSEQGFEGLANLLEEYDLADLDEEEENTPSEDEISDSYVSETSNGHKKERESPKKRFFKRIKK